MITGVKRVLQFSIFSTARNEVDIKKVRNFSLRTFISFAFSAFLWWDSLLLLVQNLDGRHFFALKVFEAGAAAGGDVGHLVG